MAKGKAMGGKVRDLGGVKAPAYGSNPKVVAEAKKPTTGTKRMDVAKEPPKGKRGGGKC